MTFPVLATTRANGTASSGSNFTFGAMPTGTTSGDLLVAFGHTVDDNANYTDPAGWTRKDSEPGNTGRSFVWARVATGTDPLVFPLSEMTNSIGIIVARITGWDGADVSSVEATLALDFSGNGDPPSHTATWGIADNLWLAVCGLEGANIAAYPSGYSGGATGFNDGVWGAVALAYKESAAASENPGTGFSTGGGTVHVGTIVVRGTAPVDGIAPTFTGGSVVTVNNFANGAGTFDADWPDATDNVAVTGYRWRAVIGGVPGSLNTLVPSSLTGGSGLTPGVSTVIEVEARDAAGNWSAVISSAAFTPGIAPTVGTNPSNQSLAVGGDAVFTSTSSAGTPTPTGQWQRNNGAGWVDIAGQTGTTYTLVNVQLSDTSAQFRRSYSNGVGAAVNSTAATLTVTPATVIGFKFSTVVGLQIGQFVGAQTGLTLSNAEAWTAFIHNDTTRALLITSGTLTTAAGRLPDYTNASLSDGTTYFVSFRRTSDGASCSCRIAAEIIP